jgi:hypothetical protein
LKTILFIILGLFLYFSIVILARDFGPLILLKAMLLGSFLVMNLLNRSWIRYHQRIGLGDIYISKLEKILLFPGIPNGYCKGNIKFQRLVLLNTIISLILMSTVFNFGISVIFQFRIIALHFIVHFVIGIAWVK